jgi:hypothetical protein
VVQVTEQRQTATVFVLSGVLLAGVAVWGALMLRGAGSHAAASADPADLGPLTRSQYAAAVAIAQHEVTKEHARRTSATAIVKRGKVAQPNLSGACVSGHEVRILLIGRFPHITVSPPPGGAGGPVRSVVITVDGVAEQACLLGVGVEHARPYRHGADLMPALAHR